jgi:hypothetical protein
MHPGWRKCHLLNQEDRARYSGVDVPIISLSGVKEISRPNSRRKNHRGINCCEGNAIIQDLVMMVGV